MILPSVGAKDAAEKFPGVSTAEVPSGKGYIRMTKPE
ncbi:unnamed protein product [Sphacelaria rigidula]